MKKILLVNTNAEQLPYPVLPIGLGLLAARIEKHYQVSIYDGVSRGHLGLADEINSFRPDLIGFSIRNIDNLDYKNPHFYLNEIKENFIEPARLASSAPFLLGGSGYSLYPELLLTFFACEYGIRGEAEGSLLTFLNAYFSNTPVGNIAGVVTNSSNNKPVILDSFEGFSSLDTRVDFNFYKSRGAYPVQTKRGCYHKCVYCTYPLIEGNSYRMREPENVIDEIASVIDRVGPQMFEFVDSTFNDPPGYAEKICENILKRRIMSKFRTMGINPANTSDKLFVLMKQAGFVQIDCTPDTASPAMIKNFRKNFTLAQLEKAACLIAKHDFPTMWFFIAAGPGETLDTFLQTLGFIDAHIDPLNMVHITTAIRIFPNTQLHRIAIKQGLVDSKSSLLLPEYYFSPDLNRKDFNVLLEEFAQKNLNFIPASESKPSAEMMREAMDRRSEQALDEPLFKTLLRVRHDWVKEGKMFVGNYSS